LRKAVQRERRFRLWSPAVRRLLCRFGVALLAINQRRIEWGWPMNPLFKCALILGAVVGGAWYFDLPHGTGFGVGFQPPFDPLGLRRDSARGGPYRMRMDPSATDQIEDRRGRGGMPAGAGDEEGHFPGPMASNMPRGRGGMICIDTWTSRPVPSSYCERGGR
jgi:hypothetical protein